jgi:cytochrome P450
MLSAVHELLRFDSPTHAVPRVALRDIELGGCTIPARSFVFAVVGAANRDPDQFPDPDRLDFDRDARTHLSFGQGIHFCLGAPLARLQAQIAFATLLRETPGLEIVAEPQWAPGFELRIPDRLMVRIPA